MLRTVNAGGVIKLSSDGHELRRFNLTNLFPGSMNPFVRDVALDSAGSIYVASNSPTAPVVKLGPAGQVLVEYTASLPRAHQMVSIAVDSALSLFALDWSSKSVCHFARNGSLLTNFSAAQGPLWPQSVAVDGAGGVWVSYNSYNRAGFLVSKFTADGVIMTSFEATPGLVPTAMALDRAGSTLLFLVNAGTTYYADMRVVAYSPDGVQLYNFSVPLPTAPSNLHGLSFDHANNIFLAADRAIVKLSSKDGRQLAVYNNSSPPLYWPGGVAFDADGNTIVADAGSDDSVRTSYRYALRLSPSGAVLQTFARNVSRGLTQRTAPLAVNSAGCVYVYDSALGVVVELSPADDVLANFSVPRSLSYLQPSSLTVDANDVLFAADARNNRVVAIAPNNTVLAVYNAPNPVDVAVDAAGCMYILCLTDARLEKRSADGRSLFNFTTANPTLYQPSAIALDAAGRLFIADQGNGRIVQLSPDGKQLAVYTTNSSMPAMSPSRVAVNPTGTRILTVSGVALIEFLVDSATPSLPASFEVVDSASVA